MAPNSIDKLVEMNQEIIKGCLWRTLAREEIVRTDFARTQEEREARQQPRGGDNMIIVLRPQVVRNLVKKPWKPLEGTEKEDEVIRSTRENYWQLQ